MAFTLGWPEISLGVVLFGALQYLASLWISERLKTSLQKEHSTFLENLKWAGGRVRGTPLLPEAVRQTVIRQAG